jgi:hypothetical protein
MQINDLKPASYNPRKITERAKGGLEGSLKRFGDISGIVWNKTTGNLVTGHQRVNVLRKLGATFQDGCLLLEGKEFKIRTVEWDDLKEKAANIEANNTHIMGTFTEDINKLLLELVDGGYDVDPLLLDDLMAEMEDLYEKVEKEEDEDSFKEEDEDSFGVSSPDFTEPTGKRRITITISYKEFKDLKRDIQSLSQKYESINVHI